MLKNLIQLIIVFALGYQLQAQLPEFGSAYFQDEVASIYISIDEDSLSEVYNSENWELKREFPASFRYESSENQDIVEEIGFRLRGNTSLNAYKKSFKVSFNSLIQGQKWQGLEKMNLNGSHNDPSMMRVALCWNAIRNAGLPGCRMSFVKLYINNNYMGLYSNVEHIDEEFTDKYFPGSQYTSLFKCLYPSTLEYISENPDDYNYLQFGRRPYDQKTNDYTQDYRELAEFIDILNNTPIEQLPCSIERRFNVDTYLKYAALEVLMGHWDSYAINKNNYYLAIDYKTGQFQYLPYDVDNTLGIDWLGNDWALEDALSWYNQDEERPLYTRLMEVETYRKRFEQYIRVYAETVLHPDTISNQISSYINLISEAAEADIYRTLDYGFTYEDFLNSPDSAWGNQVDYGIREYVRVRDSSALAQTEEQEITRFIRGGYINQTSEYAYCTLTEPGGENISLYIFENSEANALIQAFTMLDNGVFPDEIANDGIYSCAILPVVPFENNRFYYRFELNDESEHHSWPCTSRLFVKDSAEERYFNEVMSRNNSTIADDEGNFSDWIELHNPTNNIWHTDQYYITDNINYLNKWPMPDLEIFPFQFHLLWANGQEDLNRNYCNFRLAAEGETLYLVRKEEDAFVIKQTLVIPELQSNESYGPSFDGGSPWVFFGEGASTPNASNQTAGSVLLLAANFNIFPNPANETLCFSESVKQVKVYDSLGRRVLEAKNVQEIGLNRLSKGLYFLKADDRTVRFIKN